MKTVFPNHFVRHGVYVLLATLLITTVALYGYAFRISGCQQEFMSANASAQRARAEAADVERESFVRMMNTYVNNPAGFDVEARRHVKLLEDNDKLRAENPYPAPPTAC
jgi:hypothetical protein